MGQIFVPVKTSGHYIVREEVSIVSKYTIGIDFGTESGRALLVDVSTGEEVATHVTSYPNGVIDENIPNTKKVLDHNWALQHPDDYMEVLRCSVPEVLRQSEVQSSDVIGIGIDFTACTMLPVDEQGVPLCIMQEFYEHPHSWVKLWKHHAAQREAEQINHLAKKMNQPFLSRYGGKVSSEWMLPKVFQILNEAPDIFDKTDLFVEASDWIVFKMTGHMARNSCAAGYKSIWHKKEGYPEKEFLKKLDPRLEDLYQTKLRGSIIPSGTKAGELKASMAEMMGLCPGTAVAAGIIDAHAAVPAAGVVTPGKVVMSMGTSICHMLIDQTEKHVEGISGVVEDGIVPGCFGYEAGQAAVGDIFAWFLEQGVPSHIQERAEQEGKSIYDWLEESAGAYQPGESGLLALDWWNGNRSILMDSNLSGMILGYSLKTKPEEIYRALIEATAFGTRCILEAFMDSGIKIDEIYACGGLPQRNRLLMQIYADITKRKIKIANAKQTPALGASMFAAVAAGESSGGYAHIGKAAERMTHVKEEVFQPINEHTEVYDALYKEYCKLHNYFGLGANDVMKRLNQFKKNADRSIAKT